MTFLAPRDRRALGFGLLGMSLIIGAGKGVPMLRDWENRQRAAAAEVAAELTTLRRIADASVKLRERLTRNEIELTRLEPTLIAAPSPEEGAGILALLINRAADSAEVRLGAMTVRSDTTFTKGFGVATVRTNGTADLDGLMLFLRDIESGAQAMSVRELTITQPEPGGAPDKPDALRFDLVVRGLVRAVPRERGGQ